MSKVATEAHYYKHLQQTIMRYNKQAMHLLSQQKYNQSLSLLERAYKITTQHLDMKTNNLLAITLNNLGCFHKNLGNYQKALQHLRQASELPPSSLAELANLAGTYLNISSIKSSMNLHQQALQQALNAISVLQKTKNNPQTQKILIIALQNAGMECEFLSRISEAIEAYTQAFKIASVSFGVGNSVTRQLKTSLNLLSSTNSQLQKHLRHSSMEVRQSILPDLSSRYSNPKPSTSLRVSRHKPYSQRTRQNRRRPLSYQTNQTNSPLKKQILNFQTLNKSQDRSRTTRISNRTTSSIQKPPSALPPKEPTISIFTDHSRFESSLTPLQQKPSTRQKHPASLQLENLQNAQNVARAAIAELEALKKLAEEENCYEIPEINLEF